MTTESKADSSLRDPGLDALEGFVSHTTTQAIPTLYAPRRGEITAGLFFRVGRADETLATAGITHLVEHLALHGLGLSDLHYNGTTADAYTLFHVTGDEDEIVTYLNGLCAALRDLPLDRLETEKEILRTEATSRGNGPDSQLPLWRYGAQGYGLSSFEEFGTRSLTADQVRRWAETRFTRDNAVLWITSDRVPAGLDLTLPAGGRIPAPAASSALPVTPAYFRGHNGHVVFNSVLRRSTSAAVFAEVLSRALFQDLRHEGGYSYSAEAHYSPRDADFATVTAYADALPQKQDAVVGGFVDTLARLRAGTIEQSELESARGKLNKAYDAPDLGAGMLASYALSLLLGHPILTPEQHKADLHAVTVADLREVAREAWNGGLLQVPTRGADWAGLTPAPHHSSSAVTGTRHPSLEDEDVTLVIGTEGVSLLTPGGPSSVRYEACAAMTTRPDGARELTGVDGFSVTVEPTLFRDVTPERLAVLDAAVPAAAVVPLPARTAGQIPQPRERTAPGPQAAAGRGKKSGGRTAGGRTALTSRFVVLAAMAGLLPLLLLALVINAADGAHPSGFPWVAGIVLEYALIRAARRLYRARKRG
ncbi:M16 family metallopeptidase [Streptomyces sp. NPDC091209]|uniref:M16 family metallopeptidase n=1 Tax=Streptomyces sp. NPDC091209 TaxID=3365974 RepID=UPI00381B3D42